MKSRKDNCKNQEGILSQFSDKRHFSFWLNFFALIIIVEKDEEATSFEITLKNHDWKLFLISLWNVKWYSAVECEGEGNQSQWKWCISIFIIFYVIITHKISLKWLLQPKLLHEHMNLTDERDFGSVTENNSSHSWNFHSCAFSPIEHTFDENSKKKNKVILINDYYLTWNF